MQYVHCTVTYEIMPYKSKTKARECARKCFKKYKTKCLENGMCWRCNKFPHMPNTQSCHECTDKKSQNRELRIKSRLKEGLCKFCGKNANVSITSKSCVECYLKNISYKNFGVQDYWQDLKLLFEKQKEICPYTGIKLSIGVNASLDHIVPKTCGGKNELPNMQWVYFGKDFDINMMKRNFSHENFIKAIKIIYEHLNKL